MANDAVRQEALKREKVKLDADVEETEKSREERRPTNVFVTGKRLQHLQRHAVGAACAACMDAGRRCC